MITEIKKDKIYQTVKKIINQLHIFDLRGTSSSVFNSVCKKLGVCWIKEISNQTENELLSFAKKILSLSLFIL
jgi:mRNA-degrading endonuclease HigB of HigAB toxin-antitoxin module